MRICREPNTGSGTQLQVENGVKDTLMTMYHGEGHGWLFLDGAGHELGQPAVDWYF